MSDRDELEALRRLAELEAKAGGAPAAPARPPMDPPNRLERGLARFPDLISPSTERSVRGFLMGGADPSVGLAQLGLNAAGRGEGINRAVAAKEAEYQASRGQDPGFDWSRLVGNVAVAAVPGTQVARVATVPGRLAQGGLLGMVGGASAPVTDGGDNFAGAKLLQAGAGGVFGMAASGLASAAGKGWDLLSGLGQGSRRQIESYLREIFPDPVERAAAARAVGELRGMVPQEKPTVGMAAPQGHPMLAALEQQARGGATAGPDFVRRDVWNAAQRTRMLRDQADALPIVTQARADVGSPLYRAAERDLVPVDDTLSLILKGPETARLAGRMRESMQQGAVNDMVAGRAVTPTKVAGAKAPITDFAFEGQLDNVGAKGSTMTVEALQRLKQAMDAEINAASKGQPSPLGLGNVNRVQLEEARGQLIGWLNRASPKWQEARQTWAERSPPVDQAALFKRLADATESGLVGESKAAFNTQARDIAKSMERATGISRYNSEEDVLKALSPLGRRTFEGVRDSMVRSAEARSLWRPPTSVLPGMESPAEQAGSYLPPLIHAGVAAARKTLSKIGGHTDRVAQAEIDRLMLEPQRFAQVLAALGPEERRSFMAYVMQRAGPTGVTAATLGIGREMQSAP